jgi:hypothetical protein
MLTTIEIPEEVAQFELPEGVQDRLQFLLDKQDAGEDLTSAGLVDLAEFLAYLRLNAQRSQKQS